MDALTVLLCLGHRVLKYWIFTIFIAISRMQLVISDPWSWNFAYVNDPSSNGKILRGKNPGNRKSQFFGVATHFSQFQFRVKSAEKKIFPTWKYCKKKLRLIECKRIVFLKCLPVQIFHRLLPKNVSSLISFKWKKRNLMPTCNCFKWISNPICVKHSEQVSSFRAFWQLANTVCYLKARLQFTFVKWQKYYRIFQQVIEILMKIRQIEVRSALLS